MALPTAERITNKYLYKNDQVIDNRLDDNLISQKGTIISVDKKEFMKGPGRFVNASDFSIVSSFFTQKNDIVAMNREEAILSNLPEGEYSKQEILKILGYIDGNGMGVNGMFAGANKTLGFYDDGKDDLLERAYIWNSTSYKISDTARFIISKNGERKIEGFGIEPGRVNKSGEMIDDFDFVGGGWSNLVNPGLETVIDPSGIGKTVTITFTGKIDTYTLTSTAFEKEKDKKSYWSLFNGASNYMYLNKLINKLWDSGSIKHLYQEKPIIYGSLDKNGKGKDDVIIGTEITKETLGKEATIDISESKVEKGVLNLLGLPINGSSIVNLLSKTHPDYETSDILEPLINKDELIESLTKLTNHLADYVKHGIVYVTGDGNDSITGTQYNDILHGGKGDDILDGKEGYNIYYIGGSDKIITSDNSDKELIGEIRFLDKSYQIKKQDLNKEVSNLSPDNFVNLVYDEENNRSFSVWNNGSGYKNFQATTLKGELVSYNLNSKVAVFKGNGENGEKYIFEATGVEADVSDPYRNSVYKDGIVNNSLISIKKLVITEEVSGHKVTINNLVTRDSYNGHVGFNIFLSDASNSEYRVPKIWYENYVAYENGKHSSSNQHGWGDPAQESIRDNASDLDSSDGGFGGHPDNGGDGGNPGNPGGPPKDKGRHYQPYDPLVLDLDSDGIETIGYERKNGAYFDHDSDGIRTATGWLKNDDGFLVFDRNQDGKINDLTELFSDRFAEGAKHGFAALATLDENQDGVIDEKDSAFSQLQVWRDLNQDGESSTNELVSLADLKIKSLHTGFEEKTEQLNGHNFLSQLGKYETQDGTFHLMGDVNFSYQPLYSRFIDELPLNEEQQKVINLSGIGKVRDLREAATLSLELNELLTRYSGLQRREDQLALLPDILNKWAQTDTHYKDYGYQLEKTVEVDSADVSQTISVTPSQLNAIRNAKHDPQVMARFEENKHKIATINSLYSLNIKQLYYTTDADINYIIDKVDSMYQSSVVLAYRSLLPQTRLKKYFSQISFIRKQDKWLTDYSKLTPLFHKSFQDSPINALTDLIEFLSLLDNPSKWSEGLDLLSQYLAYSKENNLYASWKSDNTLKVLEKLGFRFADEGSDKDDILIGDQTGNTLRGKNGNDVLLGGRGNDILDGGLGADTYVFSKGHGQDIIWEDSDSVHRAADIDAIRFTDVNFNEVKFRQQGNDLVLFGYAGEDSVTIKRFYSHIDYQIDRFEFADRTLTLTDLKAAGMRLFGTEGNDEINDWDGNTVIDAGAGDDKIRGGNGNDTLIGNTGNDEMEGGLGADTYVFSKGHGQDIIWEDSDSVHRAADIDAIRFTDVNFNEVKFRQQGNDLVLFGYAGEDSVTIKRFYSHIDYQIDRFEFADRTLTLTDLKAAGMRLFGTEGNDEINDWDGNTVIDAGAGDDKIRGGNGNDTLIGNTGNDEMEGGLGADTYVFSKGHGRDIIWEDSDSAHRKADIDTIRFTDVNFNEVKFHRKDNDLVLFGYSNNDSIVIKRFFSHVDYQVENFVFADRTLTLKEMQSEGLCFVGTDGDDEMYDWSDGSGKAIYEGGRGNDTLNGNYGADTYIFNKGHGKDSIFEDASSAINPEDVIRFDQISDVSQLWFSRKNNSLVISELNTEDNVTIKNWYNHQNYKVEKIQLADGKSLNITQVEKLVEAMAAFESQYGGDITQASQNEIQQYLDKIAVSSYWS